MDYFEFYFASVQGIKAQVLFVFPLIRMPKVTLALPGILPVLFLWHFMLVGFGL